MKFNDTQLNTLMHLATTLAVVVGVIFVLWELAQNRELVRLEMFSEGTIANRATTVSFAGENPSVILAKACEGTEELSTEDYIVLNFIFNETMESINRMRLLENGLYPVDAWQPNLLQSRFSFIFSMPAGRAWWEARETIPAVKDPIDAYLATLGPPNCAEQYAMIKERAVEIANDWN